MKRTLLTLLVAFILVIPASDATAWPWSKQRSRKPPKDVLVEQEKRGPDRVTETIRPEKKQSDDDDPPSDTPRGKPPVSVGPPVERHLKKSRGKVLDLRALPSTRPVQRERPERHGPEPEPVLSDGANAQSSPSVRSDGFLRPVIQAAAPAPIISFDGLDRENWGAGSPPDTTGDVGPSYYIQSVNTSIGVYRKSDGFREATFTFDTLMSQGNFGNFCDDSNFGDPVVLYDTFEDRWILTDFAFRLDAGGNVTPAVAYECVAVSMTGNPVTGGWNFYSIEVTDGLNDYPKLGVWSDGIYMSANIFGHAAGASFQGARVWALNKAQMYAGSPTVQVVSFDLGPGDFTVVPSSARLQTGTPPAGRPNYFLSTWNFLNAVSVYKFHVDWNRTALSTFTGPDIPLAATSWPNAAVANAPQSGTAQLIDALGIRAMVQNQYTNIGGAESLWVPHTVRRGNTTGFAAPRWYEVNVTGGTVAATLPQSATWDPDVSNVMHRFMPSLAVDRAGNMALAYSTSSTTTFPSIKYAGRLATDPVNTFSQTEQTMLDGTASQTSSARWGYYSSVMLDPDGCTFWITNEYANPAAQTFDKRWLTRIGSFRYPECTAVGVGGTISGTVTAAAGGAFISGATVALGARSATTGAAGSYSFAGVPAGTYPSMTASFPGYITAVASDIVVTDGGTTSQNFSLDTAPASACLTDTSQADFQTGVLTNVDLTASPGDVTLANPPVIDQQNTTLGNQGAGFTATTWLGQTFTAAISGPVIRVDVTYFSLNCSAVTMPSITVAIRDAAANLPTGVDLATATIPGFCSGGSGSRTATFATPVSITAGTQYAIIWRAASAIPAGAPAPGYFGSVSVGTGAVALQNPYAGGRRMSSANSGTTWAGASGNANNDHGFKVYIDVGYVASANLVSSTKDSNAPAGLTSTWSTITWNGTTPANTTLQLQVAGSNSSTGPFTFVGPDGTASTFFASGSSIAQFYGLRHLQYKAYLATTSSVATPTLHDVQVCHANQDCSGTVATAAPATAQVCETSSGNTASGPAGATSYAWSIINGSIQGSTSSQSVSYTAGGSGNVVLMLSIATPGGCRASSSVNVPIVAVATPTITPGGPTTFCSGGSVTLTSSTATGNQWYLNGNPIGGTTNQSYIATATGGYTVVATQNGCASLPSSATNVTADPNPATPAITPGGPTTFCTGGSVALTSSTASGNQWYLNGNPIGGATNQVYVATAAGGYTVVVTSGCTSAPSSATNVTVNPDPDATITAPANIVSGSTGNPASVANGGPGATYVWTIVNGSITAGSGTADVTFTAGAVGTLTLNVTLTTAATCSDAKSVSVAVTAAPPAVTVTSLTPSNGSSLGATPVTITGSGFNSGAVVTFGGSSATSVVVVSPTQITANTPAHAAGAVNVTVTNTSATAGTLTSGYTYNRQNFDPNGDSTISPSDIFYLVAWLFTGGPAPAGAAGMASGDANGDSVVDPADIFYAVNYLFTSGPAPNARPSREFEATSVREPLSGSLSLGSAVRRDGRWFVPVIVTMDAGSAVPQAVSLRVSFTGKTGDVAVHRGSGLIPSFELSRRTANAISYLISFSGQAPLNRSRSIVMAEIEVIAPGLVRMEVDPSLTMLVGSDGVSKATVANRMLRVNGIVLGRPDVTPRHRIDQP